MKIKLALLLIALSSPVCSAPAMTIENQFFTQADGSTFQGTLKGDEHLNWIDVGGGYVSVYNNESRTYEYGVIDEDLGKLLPSNFEVTQPMNDMLSAQSIGRASERRSSSNNDESGSIIIMGAAPSGQPIPIIPITADAFEKLRDSIDKEHVDMSSNPVTEGEPKQ